MDAHRKGLLPKNTNATPGEVSCPYCRGKHTDSLVFSGLELVLCPEVSQRQRAAVDEETFHAIQRTLAARNEPGKR